VKLKFYCLTGLICLFGLTCFSQGKEYNFVNYTQENGLPSNESYFIYRDSKGFLWVATDKGVVRYDGNKMENFDLPDNVIFKIREDSKGRVWFFSHTGKLAYFFNGRIYPYKYNDNIVKTIKTLVITDAYVDSADNIIINSSVYNNYRISKSGVIEKFGYLDQSATDSNKIAINIISGRSLFAQVQAVQQSTDPIFNFSISLKTATGILHYLVPLKLSDISQYGCRTINNKDFFFFFGGNIIKLMANGAFKVKKMHTRILSLYAENSGKLWIGLEKSGAILLDTNLNEIYKPAILKFKSISSVTQDNEGGTWFSTLESGIYFLKNMHVSYLSIDSSLNKEIFRMYAADSNTLLYFKQDGLYSFTNSSKINLLKKVENSKITDLFIENGNIYAGGKIALNKKNSVSIIHVGKRKLILISSTGEIGRPFGNRVIWQNGAYIINLSKDIFARQNSVPNNIASILFEPGIAFSDQSNQIWSGTLNNLYKLDAAAGVLIPFNEPSGVFKKGITCLRQMDGGIYTIGIRFGGIAVMKDSNIIGNITEAEGLLSNSVKYLLPIKNQLWAATAKGISVIQFQSYNPLKYTITNIGKNKSFYNLIINQLVQYNGSILAATSNGIYFIDKPEEILKEEPDPIPFYINTVSYYKGDTVDVSHISVPYNKSRVIVKYTALCFNAEEEIKYYYRFDSNDTTWQTTAGTELLLENLSPGKYDIELKAAIPNENRLSGIKKLQIIVEKPWWQNGWFWLTAIIFFLGGVYILYRRRIHFITLKEKKATALNARMLELEQIALRSQMNPHFIFNCLTSIQQLIISGNKIDANEYLVKFARLIRKTLELSTNSFITIAEETDYIKEYLALEQLRIPGQFDFSVDIDKDIHVHKTEIPGMMLQPIIENSIRHGIKHLENKKGQIDILLKQDGEYILCSITDNGVGRGKLGQSNGSSFRENKSYGIEIVTKRLSAMSFNQQNEGRLEIEDLFNTDGSPAGTKVTILLPFKIKQS